MTSDDQRGTGTPDFTGHPSGGYGPGTYPDGAHAGAASTPTGPTPAYGAPDFSGYGPPDVPGYGARDFPAPAGVSALAPLPVGAHGPGAGAATKRRRGLAPLLVAASLAAVVGAGAGVGSYAYLTDGSGSSTTSPISVTTVPASRNPALDGTVSAAVEKIQPSVVTITVQSGQGGDIGTGVVLDDAGHILTNEHVVSAAAQGGSSRITVTFHDGTTAQATVVGTSGTNDLAVLKVDGVSDLVPAVFAKSDSIEVGQTVVAAGAPLGLAESVTSGIVSNPARPVRSGDNDDAVYLAVQTDAAINPGNSGGPLVDLNGSVVGINSSIASTSSGSGSGSQAGNIGIGFAIPADVAVRVAGELIENGKSVNAALGVRVGGSADSELSTATGVPLQSVTGGGAADQAGLKQGDVITKVNDFPTTTADGLIAATRFYAPGTKVTVTYVRDGGAPQTVEVTLGSQ